MTRHLSRPAGRSVPVMLASVSGLPPERSETGALASVLTLVTAAADEWALMAERGENDARCPVPGGGGQPSLTAGAEATQVAAMVLRKAQEEALAAAARYLSK